MLNVKVKVWLDENNEIVIGEGLRKLLLAIDRTGSINRASDDLRMSYRRAWEKIHLAEDRLGQTLVITQAGGAHGGGTNLTDTAKEILRKYAELEIEVSAFASERFHILFGEFK